MKSSTYLKNVSTLRLNAEKCSGCRNCTRVCPHQVLAIVNGVAEIVDQDACMECGACQKNCPDGALSVQAGVGCAAAIIGSVFSPAGGCDC